MPEQPDSPAQKRKCCCGGTDAAEVQLEEYRQVYALALYRLQALDSRTPLASGILAATIGAVGTLPVTLQQGLLLFFPLTLVWLVRSTIGHARSFEDCLRHIEGLERTLNRRFRSTLIDFQSSHPSGGIVVGGRTGEESVLTVLCTSLILLLACGFAFGALVAPTVTQMAAYILYVAAVAASMAVSFRRLLVYQYRKRRPDDLWPEPPDAGSAK